MNRRALSWTPRHRYPGIYCAPACGGGCTTEAFLRAHKDGAVLAARLGKRWTHVVWENLGWHYKVVSPGGGIKVHANSWGGKVRSFTAFVADGRFCESGKTPEAAIRRAMREARARLRELESAIKDSV